MADNRAHNLAEIEQLLATRQQLTGWLDRLDAAGSQAPESVRAKVRSDYRTRLAQVVDNLRAHADLIGSTLDGLRAQSRELHQVRGEETEVRAEAELRHSVGEYTDDEWQLVELESSGKIAGFEQELDRLRAETASLEEVQALIAPAPVRPASRAAASESAPEPFVTHEPEIPVMLEAESQSSSQMPTLSLVREAVVEEVPATPAPRPEAPRFVPRGGASKPRESGQSRGSSPFPQNAPAAPHDEMAFLRSVTIDAPPSSARVAPAPGSSVAPGSLEREERQNQVATKTLQCSECGALNRPTEWYCERCGAELAAL